MVIVLVTLSRNIRKEERNNITHLESAPLMYHTSQFMTRPETLLTFSDYVEDFKSRVEIHNYEVKKLREDIKFLFDFLMDDVYFKVVNK